MREQVKILPGGVRFHQIAERKYTGSEKHSYCLFCCFAAMIYEHVSDSRQINIQKRSHTNILILLGAKDQRLVHPHCFDPQAATATIVK